MCPYISILKVGQTLDISASSFLLIGFHGSILGTYLGDFTFFSYKLESSVKVKPCVSGKMIAAKIDANTQILLCIQNTFGRPK